MKQEHISSYGNMSSLMTVVCLRTRLDSGSPYLCQRTTPASDAFELIRTYQCTE